MIMSEIMQYAANMKIANLYVKVKGIIYSIPTDKTGPGSIVNDLMLCMAGQFIDGNIEDMGIIGSNKLTSLFRNTFAQEQPLPESIPVFSRDNYPNTRISYVYVDADNYKVHQSRVISGHMTPEMVKACMDCCDCQEFFIPSKVHLPEERFEEETDADTPWFQLSESDFYPTLDAPDETPEWVNAESIVKMFQEAAKNNWDTFSL